LLTFILLCKRYLYTYFYHDLRQRGRGRTTFDTSLRYVFYRGSTIRRDWWNLRS